MWTTQHARARDLRRAALNELLRQVIDQRLYDVNKLFFKNVADLVVAAACAPPGGGRNEVSPRLLRHFHMVWLTNLSVGSMTTIFSSIIGGYFSTIMPQYKDLGAPLVKSTVDIFIRIQKELLPSPSKSHYTFNLRDLSKVFQGLLMVHPTHLSDSDAVIKLWAQRALVSSGTGSSTRRTALV